MAKPKTETQRKLTWLQQAFVQAYVGQAQGNATEAARLAGYKGATANALACVGRDNLKLPHITTEIKRQKAQLQAKTGMDVEWFQSECRRQYDRLQDEDRLCARGYLDMLGKSIGAYDRPEGSGAGSAPTIVIHMPELPQGQTQPLLEAELVSDPDST